MSLLIKNLNESLLRKVEPELAASVVQEPIRHASTEIKKSEKKTKNRQIEETSCSSSANTSEEISNRKLKNRKQKNDSGSSGQKDKNVFREPAILKYFTEAAHPGENYRNMGLFLGFAFVNFQVLKSYVSMERKILRLRGGGGRHR